MIVFPAIDLKDGQCVRLVQGDMARATVFHDDPVAQAHAFAALGFSHLHIVDLDGAFAGRAINGAVIDAILAAGVSRVQVGGGIRDMAAIEHWFSRGAARVILGTAALRTPALVREACRAFPDQIAVGIDARGGHVAVQGWAETSALSAIDLAARFVDVGVAAIIYTDIERDGLMGGVNVEATAALARSTSIGVIASGGVGSMADIDALLLANSDEEADEEAHKIMGVICGRALYDGKLDGRALAKLEKSSEHKKP